MQYFNFDDLKTRIKKILITLKFSNIDADFLATHLVTSNLLGHHSHGVIRLPTYAQRIAKGIIDPQAKITESNISPTIAIVNGNKALGILASDVAADLAVRKAQTAGIAAIGLYNIAHTGRLGAFVEKIAQSNMIGMYFCNGHTKIKVQAPFGGKEAKLSANPLAYAAPRKEKPYIVLDMSTTAVAHGKVLNAVNRQELVAPDCLLDKNGNPTQDPQAYLQGGAMLPFGGKQAHKGFGIAILVEILSGILSQAKMHSTHFDQDSNGGFMVAFNIGHFLPLELYYEQIETLHDNLKSATPREGFDQITLPGERSHEIAQHQLKNGIEIDDKTWQDIEALEQNLPKR